jgi:multidrug efflux pump
VGGRRARAASQYTLQADVLEVLRRWTGRLQTALSRDPLFLDGNSDQEENGLQSSLEIDRGTAGRLGVTMRQDDAALNNAFGQRQVSTIYRDRNQYRVILMAEDRYWQGPEGLRDIYVPGAGGILAPLSAIATYSSTKTPVRVNHQGQTAAATISFNLDPAASLSQATERLERIKREIGMPPNVRGSFQGTARIFQATLDNQGWLILAALIALYIVLGMLYESYIHPITILSTLPSAGIGALIALRLFGMEFTLIALIGVLLLAGIVKKNAILLVDFAIAAERDEGLSPVESITKACSLRFRPIMMTTMAAILGALPLAVGFGEGSELRRPLGVSIVGGLIMSQILTLYTTPVIYLYLDSFQLRLRRMRGKLPIPLHPTAQEGR